MRVKLQALNSHEGAGGVWWQGTGTWRFGHQNTRVRQRNDEVLQQVSPPVHAVQVDRVAASRQAPSQLREAIERPSSGQCELRRHRTWTKRTSDKPSSAGKTVVRSPGTTAKEIAQNVLQGRNGKDSVSPPCPPRFMPVCCCSNFFQNLQSLAHTHSAPAPDSCCGTN